LGPRYTGTCKEKSKKGKFLFCYPLSGLFVLYSRTTIFWVENGTQKHCPVRNTKRGPLAGPVHVKEFGKNCGGPSSLRTGVDRGVSRKGERINQPDSKGKLNQKKEPLRGSDLRTLASNPRGGRELKPHGKKKGGT